MAKLEFSCDTGGEGTGKNQKLPKPKKVSIYFLRHPLRTQKSNAHMALVSATTLITEQLAFVKVLKKLQIPS